MDVGGTSCSIRPRGPVLPGHPARMTTYAYDPLLRHLIACCSGGRGTSAHTVARLHERTAERLGLRPAPQLTILCCAATSTAGPRRPSS